MRPVVATGLVTLVQWGASTCAQVSVTPNGGVAMVNVMMSKQLHKTRWQQSTGLYRTDGCTPLHSTRHNMSLSQARRERKPKVLIENGMDCCS